VWRRLLSLPAALVILGLAACGGSCGTKCNNAGAQAAKAAPTQSTVAAASTPQTASTSASITPQLSPSTPITSPAFRAVVVRVAEQGGVPPAGAGRAADCIIAGLPSIGIKTAGGFENAGNPTQVQILISRCVALARRGG
jgi:hypothetical protein